MSETTAWQPSKPTKPARPAQSKPAFETSFHFWDKHGDEYGRRVQVAIDTMCAIHPREGLIVWLDKHSPSLYNRLTHELPDKISRAWDSRVPLERFDALCSDLVDTFKFAAELYSDSKQRPGPIEPSDIAEGECGELFRIKENEAR